MGILEALNPKRQNLCGLSRGRVFEPRRPSKPKDGGPSEAPIDRYRGILANVPGPYQWEDLDVTGRPLPEKRDRLIILGVKQSGGHSSFTATKWKEQILLLEKASDALPIHSMVGMIESSRPRESSSTKPTRNAQSWTDESKYHQYFSEILGKAVSAKKIHDPKPAPVAERASRRFQLQTATAWQQANADCCEILLKQQAEAGGWTLESEELHPLFDLSQTCGHGHATLFPICSTLATSTRIFSLRTGQFLSGEAHLKTFGIIE